MTFDDIHLAVRRNSLFQSLKQSYKAVEDTYWIILVDVHVQVVLMFFVQLSLGPLFYTSSQGS